MPDPKPTEVTPPAPPRWVLTITPTGGGEANGSLTIEAEDVVQGEIVFCLLRVAQQFAARPGQRLPTTRENLATLERQQVAQLNPATAIYTGPGGKGVLFLGDAVQANDPLMGQLAERGWTRASAVPADVTRGCDHATDPDGFAAKYLTATGEA